MFPRRDFMSPMSCKFISLPGFAEVQGGFFCLAKDAKEMNARGLLTAVVRL